MTVAMTYPRRPEFARGLDLVVQKQFILNDTAYPPGTPFDQSLVSERKLKQLYDQRYLRMATAKDQSLPENGPPQPQRPALRPRAIRPRPITSN